MLIYRHMRLQNLMLRILPIRMLAVAMMSTATSAFGAVDTVRSTVVSAEPWFYLGKLGLALLTVIVFFLLFAWATKRYQNMGGSTIKGLSVVASMSLGTRERLVVVQAGSKQVLLGITSTQINPLMELEDPLDAPEPAEKASFRHSLEQLLNKDVQRS